MRSWLVIPAVAALAGGTAVALGVTPVMALAAAALAAVVRGLAGDGPAALPGVMLAPLLAVASLAEAGGVAVSAALALAAAGWAIAELGRGPEAPGSPLVAALPAAIAGVLDPSFAGLLAIAGVRLIASPGPRPRWAIAVPIAGGLAIALAVLAATAWPQLGARWLGAAGPAAGSPSALAGLAVAALGPVTAAAALAGLSALARPRYAEAGLAVASAGALAVDLATGRFGPASIGLAAILAGLAIGRLAAMIRIPSGQAITGATLGALVLAAPVWSALAHRPPAAHIGRASR